MRRILALVLVAGVIGAVYVGCGVYADHHARSVLDRVVPGQTRVLEAAPRGIDQGGYRVSAGLTDDPDAVVEVALNDSCEQGSFCEQTVREAVAVARAAAQETRTVTAVFRDCGHPIVAMQSIGVGYGAGVTVAHASVAATLDDTTLAPLAAELDRCVAAWVAAPHVPGTRGLSVSVDIVDPAVAADAPQPDPDLPLVARLTDENLDDALSASDRTVASVTSLDGSAATPIASVLRPLLPDDRQQAFEQAVLAAVQPLAAAAGANGRMDLVVPDLTRFAPGTTRELAVVVAAGQDMGPTRPAVTATVDRSGQGAHDVLPVKLIKGDDIGEFSLPTRPR